MVSLDDDERQMLYDLIHAFVIKLQTAQRLNEDLTRQLHCERERLAVLEAVHYGLC
jgi:hypothetical protein